jgi:hypothetical protein
LLANFSLRGPPANRPTGRTSSPAMPLAVRPEPEFGGSAGCSGPPRPLPDYGWSTAESCPRESVPGANGVDPAGAGSALFSPASSPSDAPTAGRRRWLRRSRIRRAGGMAAPPAGKPQPCPNSAKPLSGSARFRRTSRGFNCADAGLGFLAGSIEVGSGGRRC